MRDSVFDGFIDKLRLESDIVNVISEYVPLKKRGKNFWGCCPFHHEKTASFSVTPDRGFFYCFGCQVGGNVFNFLMKIENIDFPDAVKLLADKLGVPLPEKEISAHDRELERETANLYRANELARDFFHSCLINTRYGKVARDYLAARGISDKVIDEFRLGFSPPAWDKLSLALTSRGFAPQVLVKAGLAAERNGGGVYDRFRGRIMFPIQNAQGRVAGFGGRVLDDSQPKYLNTPETPVFNKRRLLYGYDLANQYIRQSGKVVVVEGYMDLIALKSSGINNVVASLGTAFTNEQARKLVRARASDIYFAYDSDAAGQEATVRALTTVKAIGLNVRVVAIPDGKDPDEFVRKHGEKDFYTLIDNAPGLLEYQVSRAIETTDYTGLEGKVAVVAKAVPALAEADNAVEVDNYIRKLSELLAIDEGAIRSEIRKYIAQTKKDKNVNNGKTISISSLSNRPEQSTVAAERQIIRLMLEDNSIIPYVETELSRDDIQGRERKIIINSIVDAYNMGKSLVPDAFALTLSELAASELSKIMVMDLEFGDIARIVDDLIRTIRLAHLKILLDEHSLRAHELERMGDSSFLQELAESQRIQNEISKLRLL
ncbi:MAG: primase [Firmicutes bacterium]|nr:primase [Bacillota bacterium]